MIVISSNELETINESFIKMSKHSIQTTSTEEGTEIFL